MKGIVLAGGSGTRLYPLTKGTSKQLLPIYDKPMVYYPLSVLMLSNIKDILIITSPDDLANYKRILDDGSQFGISIKYAVQPNPGGIAEAFLIGEDFIGNDRVALILGDNIFYGQNFSDNLEKASSRVAGATLFCHYVKDPERFGVIELDDNLVPLSIDEKPKKPKSNYAITGLYFYDNNVIDIAKSIKPSIRGELEITDINKIYLKNNELNIQLLGRGFTWLDTGTFDSLLEASNFVKTVQNQHGLKIGCLEEIAVAKMWISSSSLKHSLKKYNNNNDYLDYLSTIAEIDKS